MGGGKKTDVIISRGLELWLEEEGHKIKSSFFVSLWQAGAFFYSKGVYFLSFLFGKQNDPAIYLMMFSKVHHYHHHNPKYTNNMVENDRNHLKPYQK